MSATQTTQDAQIIEVISVFATRWKHEGHAPERKPDDRLGRLAQFYDLFRDKLPQMLDSREIPVEDLEFEPENGAGRRIDAISSARLQLFVLPSNQVVAALILFFHSPNLNADVKAAEEILDLCGYAQVAIGKVGLATYIGEYARDNRNNIRSCSSGTLASIRRRTGTSSTGFSAVPTRRTGRR